MMNLILSIAKDYETKLVDFETGEILAEGQTAINNFLLKNEGRYILKLF